VLKKAVTTVTTVTTNRINNLRVTVSFLVWLQRLQNQHFCNRCNRFIFGLVTEIPASLLVVTVVTVVTAFFSTFLFITENQNGYTEMAGEKKCVSLEYQGVFAKTYTMNSVDIYCERNHGKRGKFGRRICAQNIFNHARNRQADGIREIKSGLAHRNILSGSTRLAAGTGGETHGGDMLTGT
jgi:hypothetical protein